MKNSFINLITTKFVYERLQNLNSFKKIIKFIIHKNYTTWKSFFLLFLLLLMSVVCPYFLISWIVIILCILFSLDPLILSCFYNIYRNIIKNFCAFLSSMTNLKTLHTCILRSFIYLLNYFWSILIWYW